MKQIRNNVFETNSSSTHSFTLCTEEDYQKFVEGKLFISYHGKLSKDKDGMTFEEYESSKADCAEEEFDETLTTKNGDVVHAFGYFGQELIYETD